ncbi:MAG: zinc-dependent metalloprotease, partial [Bacteroidota bacterium]
MLRFLLILLLPASVWAQTLTIAEKTVGFDCKPGFVTVCWDASAGKVWLDIERFDEDFLYVNSLPAGLGSNDVGLDRGQLGGERIVRFERIGNKVLLVQPNLDYRAVTDNAAERKAVEDAFAESVLFGFDVAAETDGRVLVDATAFVVRDAHGVVRRLKNTRQGSFSLEKSRSTPYPANIKAFPDNTEMEARLTFTGSEPGRFVRQVAADPTSFSVRVRHSFVRLPDAGYTPRELHPQSGFFGITYVDYATPIGTRKENTLIVRHRLEKQDPTAEMSPAVEPIVYYLDPGTPEPVRGALLDGARWWAASFEAAGFTDAYRVEVLPDTADPMDVRYNTIQWVHRATRGWSYGGSVVDPRTGEIIKGHVTLGSLRVRQDYLIAEGLLAPYDGTFDSENDPMLELALARIRQLSAHEVGHTLGIAHNFAASTNGRTSVMDYPAPLATVGTDGLVDVSAAYATGIGAWDTQAVKYGYGVFEDEQAGLQAVLDETRALGLRYITDSDARPMGGAHPVAHLWDNGTTALEGLSTAMAVREVALRRFNENVIREGRPLAMLEETLVPLYLGHRYAVEAAVKLVAGADYDYTVRGDSATTVVPVPANVQTQAVDQLLDVVTPRALRMPPAAMDQIPPRLPGFPSTRELFDGHTGLLFDAIAPARTVSDLVFSLLTHPQRAARLAYQPIAAPQLPDLNDVLMTVRRRVFDVDLPRNAYDAELMRTVQRAWVDALLRLGQTD